MKNIAIGAVLLLVCFFVFRGCRGPGKVNAKTYEFAKTLLLANMRRDDPRLPQTRAETIGTIADQITAAEAAGEISTSESEMLDNIVQLSLSGEQQEAKNLLRELMDAQREDSNGTTRAVHEH